MRPRGAQLRCPLKPGDTDSAVGGPQLDRSGEQHGGGGARAGLHRHPQRGDEREDACPFLPGTASLWAVTARVTAREQDRSLR